MTLPSDEGHCEVVVIRNKNEPFAWMQVKALPSERLIIEVMLVRSNMVKIRDTLNELIEELAKETN